MPHKNIAVNIEHFLAGFSFVKNLLFSVPEYAIPTTTTTI
jgi:hypothetical protein